MLPKGIGKLRHRIDLMAPVGLIQNPAGAPVGGYVKVATVWASVDPQAGRELQLAQQMQADASHWIICRFYPGVTPVWKAMFNGRSLNFMSVKNFEEKNEYLVIGTGEYQG